MFVIAIVNMPQNFFITGNPNTGKTTLLKEIVDELKKNGLRVGGIVSPEERHHGTRTAFYVMDINTGKKALLASVKGDGPKVSKYYVNIQSFESIAIPVMQKYGNYDVFVIDEIGRMEMKSKRFAALLEDIIESGIPFIASAHNEYLETYGMHGEVFVLDGSNREKTYAEIIRKAKQGIVKKSTASSYQRTGNVKRPEVRRVRKKEIRSGKEEQMRKRKGPKFAARAEIPTTAKKEKYESAPKQTRSKANELDTKKPKEKKKGLLGKIIDLLAG